MKIDKGFDDNLWKGGVLDGAFSGEKDDDAAWYVLEEDGKKVALASCVPGPGELTTISYFVHPSHRGLGYGTKLASHLTGLYKNASFTIFRANEASIKVALAALRQKFSMTIGREVVRLTKEGKKKEEEKPEAPKGPPLISYLDDVAMILKGLKNEAPVIAKAATDKFHKNTVGTTLESKLHEGFTVASDRLFRAGILNTQERIALSGAIGEMLGNFRKKIDPAVYARPMTQNAHEHLKAAVLRSTAERALRARVLQARKFTSGFAKMRGVESAARSVQAQPAVPVEGSERKQLLSSLRGLKALVNAGKGGELYKDIRAAEQKAPQKELFG